MLTGGHVDTTHKPWPVPQVEFGQRRNNGWLPWSISRFPHDGGNLLRKTTGGSRELRGAYKKQKNKYVARSLYQKYKDVQYKARAKAKANCGISREPYGKNCGRCIGHGYPVSIIKWNKPGSDYNGRLCEVCNWAFNSKREGGDRRRCGHQVML